MATIGLISDIHANSIALEAVLAELGKRHITRIICAGDLVGYNAFPRETLSMLRRHSVASVHGNHDLMVLGHLSAYHLGPRAQRAVAWTRRVMSEQELNELSALPSMRVLGDGIVCMHSGIGDSVVRIERDAQFREHARALRNLQPDTTVCISGHTHRAQATLVRDDGTVQTLRTETVSLTDGGIWFINPGSVGEPREADARASYAILDWPARQVTFHHVEYDIAGVAEINLRRLPPLEAPAATVLASLMGRVRAAAHVLAHRRR